ncbi:hypothetical protein PRIPAC_70538 [Pristionchus pacificus]|uniref:Uncharacterized protein n=1 Tax=Pristionchus pacificus TaxID=54126 RepID=A0A2A6C7G8_PRIPA|nr:hypothetical protein PRIPAC_70538 [Pristionchus pacificus]|eukprot:PDM74046.1 hypothetical protein PRIPAC_41402 [Pristionchus pacificus]
MFHSVVTAPNSVLSEQCFPSQTTVVVQLQRRQVIESKWGDSRSGAILKKKLTTWMKKILARALTLASFERQYAFAVV